MSQFDKYSEADYVEALRSFLKIKKTGFLKDNGLLPEGHTGQQGRTGAYQDAAIEHLENEVNIKAQRAEAVDTSMGERLKIARDYKGWGDSDVGRALGVSRETVRLWSENIHPVPDIPTVSQLLDVPVNWLESGSDMHLPADSHIGVRVGNERALHRENLYARTLEIIPEIPETADLEYAQAYIENKVKTDKDLSRLARRAGGRWQIYKGTLVFAPWLPIEEYKMSRKLWSPEVEAIIVEELASKPTVYGAWKSLEARCKAMGLSEKKFPQKISLYKRVENERKRIEKFGVNLNEAIAEAQQKCAKPH